MIIITVHVKKSNINENNNKSLERKIIFLFLLGYSVGQRTGQLFFSSLPTAQIVRVHWRSKTRLSTVIKMILQQLNEIFFSYFVKVVYSNLAIKQASDSRRRRTFISIFDIKQSNNMNIHAYLRHLIVFVFEILSAWGHVSEKNFNTIIIHLSLEITSAR